MSDKHRRTLTNRIIHLLERYSILWYYVKNGEVIFKDDKEFKTRIVLKDKSTDNTLRKFNTCEFIVNHVKQLPYDYDNYEIMIYSLLLTTMQSFDRENPMYSDLYKCYRIIRHVFRHRESYDDSTFIFTDKNGNTFHLIKIIKLYCQSFLSNIKYMSNDYKTITSIFTVILLEPLLE